ncbi:hypothetical protein TRAPUB_11057 [Trametes pubescens]|uniref:F-box domain-containing protein n=1 Tax=Trametes pubescens TaxID=154538 RepID=A0A1M2VXS9_TRAPU|nr:hypothetical protein TRAPUB_11057 [Trametes pubescens]
MTSVALNAEIVSSIASFAYWGTNRPGVPLDLRAVLALALTCRAFLDPALDQLWRRQLTLFNLAKTLPSNAWEVYEDDKTKLDKTQRLIKTTRIIVPKDWTRFNYYAAKIKELGYDPRAPFGTTELAPPTQRTEGISLEFFTSMIIVRAPYELVPHVRRLRWTAHESLLGIRPHVYTFLNAPLAALALEFPAHAEPPTQYYADAVFVKWTLQAVAEQCLAVREVDLTWTQFEGYAGALSEFLRAVGPRLHAFVANVQAWKEEDLARLAGLPELRRTRLYLEGTAFPWLVHADALPPFSSLVDLTLDAPSLDHCTAFFRALGPCRLEKLSVNTGERPSTSMVQEFCTTLAACCTSSALRALSLSDTGGDSAATPARADCFITNETLLPLTSFPGLRAFKLDLSGLCALDDLFPTKHLPAWPALEALSLGATHGWGQRPALTFTGLAHIVQLCPMLEEVCVAIDASRDTVPPGAQPNERMVAIDLVDSYIPQSEAGAVALSRNLAELFPELEHISAKIREVKEPGHTEAMQEGVSATTEGSGLATKEFWREVEKQVATFVITVCPELRDVAQVTW